MQSDTQRFIAAMKQKELLSQQRALEVEYTALVTKVDAMTSAAQRVRALHDGLRALQMAGKPAHPNLPAAGALLFAIDRGRHVDLEAAERRLRAELQRGRARVAAMVAFSAVLAAPGELAAEPDGSVAAHAPRLDRDALVASARALGFDSQGFTRSLDEFEEESVLEDILHALSTNAELEREVRQEAQQFVDYRVSAEQQALRGETSSFVVPVAYQALKDAVALFAAAGLPQNVWPGPVQRRAVRGGDRWREHLSLPLVERIKIEIFGRRLSAIVSPLMRGMHAHRLTRYFKLRELKAPDIIVQNEQTMIDRPLGVLSDRRIRDSEIDPDATWLARERRQEELHGQALSAGPEGYGAYGNVGAQLAQIVNAELVLRRDLADDAAIYVARLDVRACFASIRHDVVDALLDAVGAPDAWRAWVLDAIAPPAADGACPSVGLPLGFTHSRAAADLVLAYVEAKMRAAWERDHAHLLVRAVDDFVLVTDSKAALERAVVAAREALDDVGLELNVDKSGVAGLGASSPNILGGGVVLGALELTPQGLEPSASAIEACARAVTESHDPKGEFNRQLTFLMQGLLAADPVGWPAEDHAGRVADAVARFERAVIGSPSGTLAGWAKERLGVTNAPLPDAWLHWPVSAGGAGLSDPTIELMLRQPDPEWAAKDLSIEVRYRALLFGEAVPSRDEDTKGQEHDAVFDARLREFLKRRASLGGTSSAELAPYWRAVLAHHGPMILDALGSYDFIDARLIPLELLGR